MISVLIITLALSACGKDNKEASKTITVAATPAPHGDVLKHAQEAMKKKGYDLKVKIVNDYKVPNKLLDKGDVDANFFQHVPYLKAERKSHGYKIEEVGKVFTTPMGVYSKNISILKTYQMVQPFMFQIIQQKKDAFIIFVNEGLIKLKKSEN